MSRPLVKFRVFIPLKIVELLVGAGGGWLFSVLAPGAGAGVSVMFGFVILILWEVVEARFEIVMDTRELAAELRSDLERHDHKLSQLAKVMEGDVGERALLLHAVGYAGRIIGRDETPTAWKDLTWRLRKDYVATNYIDLTHFYETGYADTVLSVQRAKIRAAGVKIRKVFICDRPEELATQKGRELVAEHRQAKTEMEVRKILRSKMDSMAIVQDHQRKMQAVRSRLRAVDHARSLDFAVFDDQVALVWHLDQKREIVSSEVIVGEDEVAAFVACFGFLFEAAEVA